MEREIFVYIDLEETPILVGRLWSHVRGRNESASFEYDHTWLKFGDRFSLEPALTLDRGTFHTTQNKTLFGSLGDSCPDRWGRTLMRRAERLRAKKENENPRTLFEIDYLLMVNDLSRQGALRFSSELGGTFHSDGSLQVIPPLVDLPRLLNASDHVSEESETEQELKLLLAPGSSLGGARPKASVRNPDGSLLIAKFPQKDDEIDVVSWEAVALSLALKAGINVPKWRIEDVKKKKVLLLNRFDRVGSRRIPFLSAMSMLSAHDNETRSYLELVDAIRQFGALPKLDMLELWKRMVFNILISNTDDHLRNHGFLYQNNEGWRLSPAYDLNPVPTDIRPRILSTNITEYDATASLELAFEVISYFELKLNEVRKIAYKIGKVVSTWQSEAKTFGLSKSAIGRCASAFEHEDLKLALSGDKK